MYVYSIARVGQTVACSQARANDRRGNNRSRCMAIPVFRIDLPDRGTSRVSRATGDPTRLHVTTLLVMPHFFSPELHRSIALDPLCAPKTV